MVPVEFWLIDLDVDDAKHSRLEGLLSSDELEHRARFAFADDRRNYAAARGQVREILGSITGLSPAQLEFLVGADGKPYLATGPRFNISHSGNLAVLAVTPSVEIGVDVEEVRPMSEDLGGVAFTAREMTAMNALAGKASLEYRYRLWTCKEAVVKARGTGLLVSPLSFSIDFWDDEHGMVVYADPADSIAGPARVRTVMPRRGFIAAVAAVGDAPVSITKCGPVVSRTT